MKNSTALTLLLLCSAPATGHDMQHVVVMSSYPQELIARYEVAFEAAHPHIDMVLEWRRGDDAVQWLQTDNNDVDVYWSPALDSFTRLADADYFETLSLPYAGAPGRIGDLTLDDPQQRFMAFEVAGFGFAYSPAWLAAHDLSLPQDWQELRDPRYAGAVQLPVPSQQGFAPMIYASILSGLGWEEGWELIAAIAAYNRLNSGRGGDFIDGLVSGEIGIALSIDFFPNSARMNGLPVDFRYANTTLLSPAYIAQLRQAPRPSAAQAFMDFVMSTPGQTLLLHRDLARLPVRPDAYDDAAQFNPFADQVNIPAFDLQRAGAWESLIGALFDVQISDRHQRLHTLLVQIDTLAASAHLNAAQAAQLTQARQTLLAPAINSRTAMKIIEQLQTGEIMASALALENWTDTLHRREQAAIAILAQTPTQ